MARCGFLFRLIFVFHVVPMLFGCAPLADRGVAFPQKPIKVVVPFAAGGGSDTFARIIQNAIEDEALLPQKLVIVNVPGAGGTIGSRRVKNARPDGYTLLLLHEAILTAKYAGQANFGAEAFEAIAGTGDATQVIAVAEESPYADLGSLMRDVAANPDTIVFSANIGAPSHVAGLMLEKQAGGAKFRYTQTGGGAKRFAAIKGRHVDVSSFSVAEYQQFRPAGMRALAMLSTDRHPGFPEVPTANEQGYEVLSPNMQFWWAPAGTPPDRIDVIAEALDRAMQTDRVQSKLREIRIDPIVLRNETLRAEIDQRAARIAAVAQRPAADLPKFPAIVFCISILLGFTSWATSRQAAVERHGQTVRANVTLAAAAIVITMIYVAAMQFTPIGFRAATILFILTMGGMLSNRSRHTWPILIVIAVTMSCGVHFLFTEVLVVDLP